MKLILDAGHYNTVIDRLTIIAQQATCTRSKCGSVIIDDNGIIIGEGFNSQPCSNSIVECFKDDLPKDFKSDKTCCIHAEQRAILYALKYFPGQIKGSMLFFLRLDENDRPKNSGQPYCTICSKMALEVGISKFVLWHKEGWTAYDTDYYNKLSFQYKEQ
jgi:deoxycytidylate deaminase